VDTPTLTEIRSRCSVSDEISEKKLEATHRSSKRASRSSAPLLSRFLPRFSLSFLRLSRFAVWRNSQDANASWRLTHSIVLERKREREATSLQREPQRAEERTRGGFTLRACAVVRAAFRNPSSESRYSHVAINRARLAEVAIEINRLAARDLSRLITFAEWKNARGFKFISELRVRTLEREVKIANYLSYQ